VSGTTAVDDPGERANVSRSTSSDATAATTVAAQPAQSQQQSETLLAQNQATPQPRNDTSANDRSTGNDRSSANNRSNNNDSATELPRTAGSLGWVVAVGIVSLLLAAMVRVVKHIA
jgi:hypothetical protein